MASDIILDCYTDEPSGFGVPPYLGVHPRYVAGSLSLLGRTYEYLTIDDVRYAQGERDTDPMTSNVRIHNRTTNAPNATQLLLEASVIHVVLGRFTAYQYLSAEPPTVAEVASLLAPYKGRKILYYVLGSHATDLADSGPFRVFDTIVTGNSYNYLLNGTPESFDANYALLRDVVLRPARILSTLKLAPIVEVETGSGCERKPGCSFCIENARALPCTYRPAEDILTEIAALYGQGVRHFRLGRQPDFYAYQNHDPNAIERLLRDIRLQCPDLKTLHVDNVNPESVVATDGHAISASIVAHCTSGNIAPFGIESFDPVVRQQNNLNGTISDIMSAIAVLNALGSTPGPNGLPRFLPGINLIHGLPGETAYSHETNMAALRSILDHGWLTRRLFHRRLTVHAGVDLDVLPRGWDTQDMYASSCADIESQFVRPMLRRVVPEGLVLSDVVAEVHRQGATLARQLGTCPIRVVIPQEQLPLRLPFTAQVIGYQDGRTVIGAVLR